MPTSDVDLDLLAHSIVRQSVVDPDTAGVYLAVNGVANDQTSAVERIPVLLVDEAHDLARHALAIGQGLGVAVRDVQKEAHGRQHRRGTGYQPPRRAPTTQRRLLRIHGQTVLPSGPQTREAAQATTPRHPSARHTAQHISP